jgi:NADPH:quinone reductase-like Zn-dependent oxidoreductase
MFKIEKTMKAITYQKYGPPNVLQLAEIDKPVPKDKEILVKIKATSVGYGDSLARNFKAVTPGKLNMPFIFWFMAKFYFGWNKPKVKVLGSVFSGEVESTGQQAKLFKPGDQVFGFIGQQMGAYAEYLCIPENGCVALKPENISHEEAALSSYGPVMALPLLRKVNIQPGQKVLIIGASGGIGAAAVQIAKHFGATVTGVCGTHRVEYVTSLGANKVIDYNHVDFTQNGETYDLIFDVLGRTTFFQCKKSLTPNGIYLLASFKTRQLMQMLWTKWVGGRRVICALAPGSANDLQQVKDLIEKGKIISIIDRKFSLEQMAEAHTYYESRERKGNVVIVVNQE